MLGGMPIHFDKRRYPRLFLTRSSSTHGVTDWELRRPTPIASVLHGVRMDPRQEVLRAVPRWADTAWEMQSHLLRALLLKHPTVAASHTSAAVLYGLPLPNRFADPRLHVATTVKNARIRRPGVVLHRVTDFGFVTILGHQLISAPYLFLQLAPAWQLQDLVRLGDAMIGNWHGPPLCSLGALTQLAASKKYLRGRERVQAALGLIRPDVDSPMETDLRLWTISVGLPEPSVHPAVHCSALGCEVHPDLGYREAQLALEYEGDHHRTDRRQWDTDISRVNALVQEGWQVIRVNSRTDRRTLEQTIRARLRESGLIP